MAALGLMAFTAVAAQAETLSDGGKEGSFLVNKEKALAKLGVTFEANQVGTGTLLVPGRVDILCTEGKTTGEFEDNTKAFGKASFTGCTAWQPVAEGAAHVTQVKCTVKTPIEVKKGQALPKKHEGSAYILLEEEGELFTTIFLEGPECPLTKENKVTGSVLGLVDKNETTEPSLLFSQAIAKLFQPTATTGNHLKFGAFEAYLDATAEGKLTDVNHTGEGKEFPLGVC